MVNYLILMTCLRRETTTNKGNSKKRYYFCKRKIGIQYKFFFPSVSDPS